MILWPAASMALARARTSKADSVPSLPMRSASRNSVMAPMIGLWRICGKSQECCDLVILSAAHRHVTLEVCAAQGGAGMGAGPVARSGSGLDPGQLFAAAEADFA